MRNKRENYYYVWVMGIATLFGGAFWLADGIYQYYFFHKNLKFLLLEGPESLLDSIVFNVPPRAIVVRISFIIACLIGGLLVTVFLHRQREAQKGLAQSEEKYRTLYDSSRDAIMILTPDKGFFSGNLATIKIFGCQKEDEFISLTLEDLSPEYQPDGALSVEKAEKMMAIASDQDSHFFEWKYKRVDGEEFYATVLLTRMELHDEIFLQATVRDITEQKQAEETLRESELKYKTLFEGTAEGVLVANIETHEFKYANPSICEMLGYTQEELIGMEVGDLHPKKAVKDMISGFEAQARGEKTLAPNIPCLRKDGSTIYADIRSTKVMIDRRECNVGLFADITERKRAEEELAKHRDHLEEIVRIRTAELDKRISEVEQLNSAMVNLLEDLQVSNENLELTASQLRDTNKELESFSYSVSHDLRAPLRAIDGFSKMLVEDHGDKLDADSQRQLNVICDSARNMGELIDGLLSLSRLGRKEMQMSEMNMGKLAEEVFEQLMIGISGRKIKLNLDTLPNAQGDPSLIREVFMNLLSNAIKFTEPKPDVTIDVDATGDERETTYCVRDNGVGFDMKYADKLFQVFQRLHSAEEFEGTGIGLALVQRIVQRHGGRVWAEGEVNKGATFYFSLPSS